MNGPSAPMTRGLVACAGCRAGDRDGDVSPGGAIVEATGLDAIATGCSSFDAWALEVSAVPGVAGAPATAAAGGAAKTGAAGPTMKTAVTRVRARY